MRKDFLESLQNIFKSEAVVIRPWGSYVVLKEEKGYKVKKIIVLPNQRLSLQMHNHRSEHWAVIEGKAKVRIGSKEYYLKKGESCFVPLKTKHRLENPFDEQLKIVEIQNGDYLKEDDIIRLEDDYNRK
ncbi:MAG: phosphomannose isomerase type II C-terminal cupin domain [Candidatus Pacebacteria bacterium]|nr:phosphomannose isomerase type II C-terminal cupin domain [Candidatus Paceibacterota bacterium]